MSFQLSNMGAVSEELARTVHSTWAAAAITVGMDLTGFDPASPLPSGNGMPQKLAEPSLRRGQSLLLMWLAGSTTHWSSCVM